MTNYDLFWERPDFAVTHFMDDVDPEALVEAHAEMISQAPLGRFAWMSILDNRASLARFTTDFFNVRILPEFEKHQETRKRLWRTAWVTNEHQKAVMSSWRSIAPIERNSRCEIFNSVLAARKWAEEAGPVGRLKAPQNFVYSDAI